MKHAVYVFVVAVISMLLIVTTVSVQARGTREKEVRDSLASAVDSAANELNVTDFNEMQTDEELIALFEQILFDKLNVTGEGDDDGDAKDPNFGITVKVAGADADKGLLFVDVVETFTYPNGQTGEITETADLVVERETPKQSATLSYQRNKDIVKAETIEQMEYIEEIVMKTKSYTIEEGMFAIAPATYEKWNPDAGQFGAFQSVSTNGKVWKAVITDQSKSGVAQGKEFTTSGDGYLYEKGTGKKVMIGGRAQDRSGQYYHINADVTFETN